MRIAAIVRAPSMDERLSMDEALRKMDIAAKVADLIEVRIDYLENLKTKDLEKIIRHSQLPIIITNRHPNEDGIHPKKDRIYTGSEEKRIALLQDAIYLGADYVDIELRYFHELDQKDTKLIVSYHNFKETPQDLQGIYNKILAKNPDIGKIATKANNRLATKANNLSDSLRMLGLITDSERYIIGICMGEKGRDTRIMGPVVGGYLTFGLLTKEELMPGEVTVDEIKREWDARGYSNNDSNIILTKQHNL